MLHALSQAEFDAILADKRRKFDHFYPIGLSVLTEITTDFLDKLDGNQVAILLFLWNRTFHYSRSGAQIYFYQFMRGVEARETGERICSPLGMSDRTLRKHLASLCQDDYIHIYCRAGSDEVENTPRIYEINVEKFVKTTQEIGEKDMLPTPKRLKAPPGRNFEGGLEETTTHKSYIKNVSTKVDIPLPTSRQRRADFGGAKSVATVGEESALAVIQQITRKHRETRTARATSALSATAKIDALQVQALVDQVRMQYTPGALRMMVTQKAFGMFRKNLKANPPDDLEKFLTHVLVYWTDIAQANAKAILRAGTKREPIPAAPDFTALAYRYNYFLKIYASGNVQAKESEQAKEITLLKSQLARVKADNGDLRRLARSRPATPAPEAPAAPSRPVRQARIASARDDDDLPAWDEPATTGVRRHG